jgi:hypothetical protein
MVGRYKKRVFLEEKSFTFTLASWNSEVYF